MPSGKRPALEHTKQAIQTVHALAAYLAAAPRSSTNEPSTADEPHLTCCKN